MLEHIQKLTPPDHADLENLPITLGVLNQLLKSTQPGIAAAESESSVAEWGWTGY